MVDVGRVGVAVEPHPEEPGHLDLEPRLLPGLPGRGGHRVLVGVAEAAGDVPTPPPGLDRPPQKQQPPLAVRDEYTGAGLGVAPLCDAAGVAPDRGTGGEGRATGRAVRCHDPGA